ncbi:hypothetical protein NA56DRAFT_72012 [Hyaloscypha hepaticicola]|uniref:Heterokaryon incompatibility domain-containing protein n=1 Tax=Hyaloscypha hepaticicola TaxID=2082293 RepID=A0A2J6QB22_9HELO|nr:hypothetical protein NA56DRAFT_72012 [Hyaloscypha hepaticicola]
MNLHPGRPSDPVSCHLTLADLNTSLEYNALSYEWKINNGFTNIACGGTSLKATHNLVAALLSLRRFDRPMVFWIDAVCINQKDQEEKSKQIPLMHDIYAKAKSVLVWLGPSFRGVKAAFDVLPYLAMVGVERHTTEKPDTEKLEDILSSNIKERPKQGSIIQRQDDLGFATHDRDSILTHTIKRHPELDDDIIFRFDDHETWAAIDRLFSDSYFQRSWIIQEVAVAEAVYVFCGSHSIHWDIFQMAFEGRSKMIFQPQKGLQSYIPCVRDARTRYRDYESARRLDLGIVLTSFSYSKATNPRDCVYAALGIVKPRSLCRDIVPDYTKEVKDVFYEAACHIILLRKDLYLWSSKTLMSRRATPKLPSWVPELTMAPCEEAIEFATLEFSRCLSCNPFIDGKYLFVDGHLLDEIDTIYPIKDPKDVLELSVRLEEWLKNRDKTMFSAYYGDPQNLTGQTIPCSAASSDRLREEIKSEVSQLLSRFRDVPPIIASILRNLALKPRHSDESIQLNIEALWSALTAVFYRRTKLPKPVGYHLFLAALYILPRLALRRVNVPKGLPKGFNEWIMAAIILYYEKELIPIFIEHFRTYDEFTGMVMEDRFFVTKKGFFGCAPAEAVKQGQIVAIIGGAYVPYVLEKCEGYYKLVAHAYVEGIIRMKSLPAGWKLDRIEIR